MPAYPYQDRQGGLVMLATFGQNVASSGATTVVQDRPGAPFQVAAAFRGSTPAGAVSGSFAFLATSAPESGDRTVYRGVDRLGPLGLVSPATAPVGGKVNVRLNLWKPTTVTVRLRGGPARAQVTKGLPAGRSVVSLRLPKRAGAYLVQAAGRETPKSKLMTQKAVVRAR